MATCFENSTLYALETQLAKHNYLAGARARSTGIQGGVFWQGVIACSGNEGDSPVPFLEDGDNDGFFTVRWEGLYSKSGPNPDMQVF
jgi:hypothetical protein